MPVTVYADETNMQESAALPVAQETPIIRNEDGDLLVGYIDDDAGIDWMVDNNYPVERAVDLSGEGWNPESSMEARENIEEGLQRAAFFYAILG